MRSSTPPGDMHDAASEPVRDGGALEAAHYLMGAIGDLSQLARRHKLDMLGYLLDMARLEAEETIRNGGLRKS